MAWLLCDYGEVLCRPPSARSWDHLEGAARAAGWRPRDGDLATLYWRHRPEYDRGDVSARLYWERALGALPDARHLTELVRRDVALWTSPNRPALDAARRAGRKGFRLAILSNAPVEVAAGIAGLPWLAAFERKFFSCHLRSVKPERAAYEAVLSALGADPAEVVFFDDRAHNVAAAAELGMRAVLFRDASQMEAIAA